MVPELDLIVFFPSERDCLADVLDQQRAALVRKVTGVSSEQARQVPTASSLSLLSLLKHCAVWEVRWFQGVVAGEPFELDDEFLLDPDDTLELWLARYEEACEASRRIAASRELDAPIARRDIVDGNLRWVLLHLIEETARHAGHADILRESLDGSRGM